MDWYSVLTKYGVNVPNAEQFVIHCPFHDDNRQSCSINTDKGVWICFAGCGQGSLSYFIYKLSGKSWEKIRDELDSPDLDFDFGTFAEDSSYEIDEVDSSETQEKMVYDVDDNHWIYNRQFTKKIINLYNCKQNDYKDLMIPVEEQDISLGWIYRRTKAVPKYLYSKGFRKSKTLFGLNQLKDNKVIYLVEGALDSMWLTQHGYDSLAILGASVSTTQIERLSSLNPDEVVLCLDNDDAGKQGTKKATIDMQDRFMITFINIPIRYKDVQDIRYSNDLKSILTTRSIW